MQYSVKDVAGVHCLRQKARTNDLKNTHSLSGDGTQSMRLRLHRLRSSIGRTSFGKGNERMCAFLPQAPICPSSYPFISSHSIYPSIRPLSNSCTVSKGEATPKHRHYSIFVNWNLGSCSTKNKEMLSAWCGHGYSILKPGERKGT